MTTDDFVSRVGELVAGSRSQEALDFAAQVGPTLGDILTIEQLDFIGGMLEMAIMRVKALEALDEQAARTASHPDQG